MLMDDDASFWKLQVGSRASPVPATLRGFVMKEPTTLQPVRSLRVAENITELMGQTPMLHLGRTVAP